MVAVATLTKYSAPQHLINEHKNDEMLLKLDKNQKHTQTKTKLIRKKKRD